MDGHSTYTSALRLAAAATAVLLVLPLSAVRAPSDASRVPRGGDAPSGIILAPMSLPSLRESYMLRAAADADRALKKGAALRLLASESIPPRWDSREHGWTTPVRNQRSYGTCWAFAATAAAGEPRTTP
jgi:C1A family cysteine protease